MANRSLYVAISPHGFGHLSQTAQVLKELFRRRPELRIVVETTIPREVLARFLPMPFVHEPHTGDFGMVMRDALTVSLEESHARYVELHRNLERHVSDAAERLTHHRAGWLLSNVSYVAILAAKRLGIPALALSCLNWADIYGAICGAMPGAEKVHSEMLRVYQRADTFMVTEPGMPMKNLDNISRIGPIARVGVRRREILASKLGVAPDTRLVTISMGGIQTELHLDRLPEVRSVKWLVDVASCPQRNDIARIADLGMPYLDILCSSDVVITKPGYGSFAEAACNGIPVLYVPREGWPEAPYLTQWLQVNAQCLEIEYEDIFSNRLGKALDELWSRPAHPRVEPSGIAQAVDIFEAKLDQMAVRSEV